MYAAKQFYKERMKPATVGRRKRKNRAKQSEELNLRIFLWNRLMFAASSFFGPVVKGSDGLVNY